MFVVMGSERKEMGERKEREKIECTRKNQREMNEAEGQEIGEKRKEIYKLHVVRTWPVVQNRFVLW